METIIRKVWDKIFGFRVGDKGFLKSIEPKSGIIHYEYCTVMEIGNGKNGRMYILRREHDQKYSWSNGDNLEKWER